MEMKKNAFQMKVPRMENYHRLLDYSYKENSVEFFSFSNSIRTANIESMRVISIALNLTL